LSSDQSTTTPLRPPSSTTPSVPVIDCSVMPLSSVSLRSSATG
jgi:hypothetical protein